MRRAKCVMAIIVGLGLAGPAWAFNFGGGSGPGPIKNVPIDTSNVVAPLPQPQRAGSGSFFSKFHLPSWIPGFGQNRSPRPGSLQPRRPIMPSN
jgi:hypothetical protein